MGWGRECRTSYAETPWGAPLGGLILPSYPPIDRHLGGLLLLASENVQNKQINSSAVIYIDRYATG